MSLAIFTSGTAMWPAPTTMSLGGDGITSKKTSACPPDAVSTDTSRECSSESRSAASRSNVCSSSASFTAPRTMRPSRIRHLAPLSSPSTPWDSTTVMSTAPAPSSLTLISS